MRGNPNIPFIRSFAFLYLALMNIVEKDQKISLAYKLKDTNGRVIEEVPPSHPFVYLHGYENIIPGLEEALDGKNLGDKFTISVSYEKGYGAYRQDLVIEVSKEELQDIGEIWIGMELEMFQDEDDSLELLCGAGCWIVLDNENGLWSCHAALPSCPKVLDENDLLAVLCGV